MRLLFLIFAVALLAPVALLVDRALHSVALERQVRQQAVAERVFDEMERGLSRLLEVEEHRPFEQYGLALEPSAFPFVVGHFQIDPDGSIHGFPATNGRTPALQQAAMGEIERVVGAHWHAGAAGASARAAAAAQVPGTTLQLGQGGSPAAAGNQPETLRSLPDESEVSTFAALRSLNRGVQERVERQKARESEPRAAAPLAAAPSDAGLQAAPSPRKEQRLEVARPTGELAPMTGRIVDGRHLLLSRTVVRETRAYRQGVLVDVEQLGAWLREQGLGGNDGGAGASALATYASVSFATAFAPAPDPVVESVFMYQHRFAEPFADLSARLALRPLPGLGSTTYVYALCVLLLVTGVLGLAALYRMVSVVVSFAERRNNFVAAVSHELKTPLTAIRMYGEMLRDGMVPSEAKRAQYYRHITVESERLSRLINNVLEFSRLEKGKRDVALVTGPVAPVVREVAELARPHVEEQGYELRLDLDDDLPPVRFERDALMQVLWNLIDNAVKYARDGSAKRIELFGRHDGSGVYLTLRDHGPGVPARHLGKIFEPFYRGESELTRRSKGTGLGLALVRGLVERMGAQVSGRNVPEGGFEVEITFQCAPGAVASLHRLVLDSHSATGETT